jgi:hypothetical protein
MSLSADMMKWWEMMRGDIRLELRKKKYKLFFIRAESSHELSRSQLKFGSFNYRVRLARAQIEPELSHEPKLFCAALYYIMDHIWYITGKQKITLIKISEASQIKNDVDWMHSLVSKLTVELIPTRLYLVELIPTRLYLVELIPTRFADN